VSLIEEADPAHGHVSASAAWTRTARERPPSDADVRVVAGSLERLDDVARLMEIKPERVDELTMSYGVTSPDGFELLATAAGAVSLWGRAERRRAARHRRSGRQREAA
jgi:hypothetical protein